MIATTRRVLNRTLDLLLMQVWLLIIPAIMFAPASLWYEIERFVVTDLYTAQGQRIVDFARTIHVNFYGTWRVEEQWRNGDGRFVTVQVCEGNAQYRIDKSPPDPVTLDWWKGENCTPPDALPAGTYRICTFVTIRPRYFPTKHVEYCSPEFTR